ncbi:MAG: hypothetical protein FWH15_09095 [Betaproteobacteria bacterium]|nr:hypothetical protein [Betaproteobacteria bacterium]
MEKADEDLIAGTSATFGSRENASKMFVERGYKLYNEGKVGMATRRFNQAWLLDPNNPMVYTGFAAVLQAQRKHCEAMSHMEKSLLIDPRVRQGIYPDTAQIITVCAFNNKALSQKEKEEHFIRSENLFKAAEAHELSESPQPEGWGFLATDEGSLRLHKTSVSLTPP